MRRSHVLLLTIILLVITAGVGVSRLASAQSTPVPNATADEPALAPPVVATPIVPPPLPNPVVAAFPALSDTSFEQDPFEPTRVRSSTTRVKRVVLVRADGSTEVKAVE